jgi:tetratricopeptide (TPR) repeat protein
MLTLVAAAPRGLGAEDVEVEKLLAEAQLQRRTMSDPESALAIYRQILANEELDPRVRGEALWGEADCLAATGRWSDAEATWTAILGDTRVPADVKARAEQARKARLEAVSTQPPDPNEETTGAQALAEREARRRAETDDALARARAAFHARKFEEARDAVTTALKLDPENAEAERLFALIEQEAPDRGELLRSMLRFFETVRSESFQRLKNRVRQIEGAGQRAHRAGDHAAADLAFREAVALIDRSEFRDALDAERWNLIFWLRQNQADGKASKGLAFPPEPRPSAGPAPEGGLRGRFYALLEESFAGRDEDGTEPLRFHEFAPLPSDDGRPRRSLGPNAFASRRIGVEQGESALTRARWAERWIRANVAGDWAARSQAARPSGRRPAPAAPPRLLERLEDVLFVQHTPAVQHEIETLRGAFAPRPPPMQVDVSVYAAGRGGTVRVATALALPAPPVRESGLDAIVPGLLIEECRRELKPLENLTLLGSAQLKLDGDTGAVLDVTELTESHPQHADLPAPPLAVPGLEAARYGLRLDVYAEDLPRLSRATPRSAAVSVAARARLVLPSVVVKKADRGGDWTRLPKFADTLVESDRRLPHAGTLVLYGLPNPFADSAAEYPDLVVLVSARPAGTEGAQAPLPDPPPWQSPGSRKESQEHPLGPMGTEVIDDLVADGWPEDHGAASPALDATARRARDDHLATLLAGRARLLSSGAPNPVSVRDGLASATAGDDEQVRLAAAVAWLASQEAALYDVDVRAFEVPDEALLPFTKRLGVTALPSGSGWLLSAGLAGPLDSELGRAEQGGGALSLVARQITRATQQIVLRRLQAHGITSQMRVVRGAGDAQRLVPVPGVAEEGLLVQVRPGLEDDGRRVVTVRVRAARLKAIESVPLRGVEIEGAAVDVPRWHPLQDRSAAAAIADGEALVLAVPIPAQPGRTLLVRVTTRKLQ